MNTAAVNGKKTSSTPRQIIVDKETRTPETAYEPNKAEKNRPPQKSDRRSFIHTHILMKSSHFKRAGIELIILFAERNEFVVIAAFNNFAALKNNNVFGVADC